MPRIEHFDAQDFAGPGEVAQIIIVPVELVDQVAAFVRRLSEQVTAPLPVTPAIGVMA